MAEDRAQERGGEGQESWPMERWPYGGGAGQYPSRAEGNDYERVRGGTRGHGDWQAQDDYPRRDEPQEPWPMQRWPYGGGAGQWPSRAEGNDYGRVRRFEHRQEQWQQGDQWPQQGERHMRQGQQGLFGLQPHQLAQGIGWFSIALGLADLLAPQKMAEWMGLSPGGNAEMLIRAVGAREIATGVGLLAQQDNPGPWFQARMAGDAMDLALLGAAFFRGDADTTRLGTALAAVAGITALDVLASAQGR